MSTTTDLAAIGGDGRLRLLDTAELLFDEHGIDGTSARAITAAAGHRNNAAVHYHFGTRDDLVNAVLTRRAPELDAARHRMLDEMEAAGTVTARGVVEAVVCPLIALLDDPGGRRYLRLLNQAANHPAFWRSARVHFASSVRRATEMVDPFLGSLAPSAKQFRGSMTVGLALHVLARQSRMIDEDPEHLPVDPEMFTDQLVTAVVAIVEAGAT